MEKLLELRMYFFVPYQLTGIQQAIQAGHASLEYAREFGQTTLFKDFVDNWKTWIILNGGTTNNNAIVDGSYLGSLNNIEYELSNNDIQYSYFNEPDLNDALTAVCFICDERVFNKKDYPDFKQYIVDNKAKSKDIEILLFARSEEDLKEMYKEEYDEWLLFIGGEKNLFLRNLIKDKKLA